MCKLVYKKQIQLFLFTNDLLTNEIPLLTKYEHTFVYDIYFYVFLYKSIFVSKNTICYVLSNIVKIHYNI